MLVRAAARRAWNDYNADKQDERIEKVALPPLDSMMIDSLSAAFREPSLNDTVLLEKARLWGSLGVEKRQALYDQVHPQLARECELFEFDLARAFPEPPGMDAYRAANPDRAKQPTEDGIETPTQPR